MLKIGAVTPKTGIADGTVLGALHRDSLFAQTHSQELKSDCSQEMTVFFAGHRGNVKTLLDRLLEFVQLQKARGRIPKDCFYNCDLAEEFSLRTRGRPRKLDTTEEKTEVFEFLDALLARGMKVGPAIQRTANRFQVRPRKIEYMVRERRKQSR